MKFLLEQVSNVIFLTALTADGEKDVIFKAWDETEFTEKKLQNQLKKIDKDLNGNYELIRAI